MDNKIDCICNLFEEIDGFYSIIEFEKFQNYIYNNIKDGYLREIPVQKKYAGFFEQWFQCNGCNQIWRLVHPDFPFRGIWSKIL